MVTSAPGLRLSERNASTDPTTADRILGAAFDRIAMVGLARTTVEDVARAAAVSRQTVYRYFVSKDHLVMSLVLREEERFLDGVREAFAQEPDLDRALERGLLFCLEFARRHPLLDRLLAAESETLLPYLTVRAAPVIGRAGAELRLLIASKTWVRADLLDGVVDMLVRLVVSHALTPTDRDASDVARSLARIATLALTGGDRIARGRTGNRRDGTRARGMEGTTS